MNPLEKIATALNKMGFPNRIVGNTIEATSPLPYSPQYVQPSFKLNYSPEQKILFYEPNRHSTAKLLRKLKPALEQIARENGLSLITHSDVD